MFTVKTLNVETDTTSVLRVPCSDASRERLESDEEAAGGQFYRCRCKPLHYNYKTKEHIDYTLYAYNYMHIMSSFWAFLIERQRYKPAWAV